MPVDTPTSPLSFAPVALQVRRRVWLRRWLRALAQGVTGISIALGLLILAVLISGASSSVSWGIFFFAAWLLGAAGWAAWKLPGAYSALAFWDAQAGRREAFATAWWFEHCDARTTLEEAHLQQQRDRLPEALKTLAQDLPVIVFKRWLELPLVLLMILVSLGGLHPTDDAMPLDETMQAAAKAEAEKLAKTDWEKKNLAGLEESEKAELEKLKENLKTTAASLENSQGQDAREVMSDLEKRAREAEKLAERLGLNKDAWASDKMIQSLRSHADTADLGDAVASKNAAQSARAADKLAEQIQSPRLTDNTRERLDETLQEIEKAAEKEDNQRLVGQHVLQAGRQMKSGQAAEAGQEFQKLADKLRDMALREKAREELEKLAQQLRDAGSKIAGQNDAGGMQEMNAAAEQNSGTASQNTPQVGQNQTGQGQQGQQALQPPGLGQMNPGSQNMQSMQPGQNPSQGQGQMQQMQMGQMGQPQPGQSGQGQPQGPPMLLAPIPGQKPGDQPPDSIIMGAPPGESSPDAPQFAISMPGGRDPGVGKAELNADPTAKQDTGNSSVVNAQSNTEGQSSVRAIEGAARHENANRSATQTAVEFIQAEEEALDDAALPPSRRAQVRRYFNELRRRFEQAPNAPQQP